MRIHLPDGRVLGIVFSHPQATRLKRKFNGKKGYPRYTLCEIFLIEGKGRTAVYTLIASGSQECSVDDAFSKEVGRKRALGRAFDSIKQTAKEFDKIDRTLVWRAYHSRGGIIRHEVPDHKVFTVKGAVK